MNITLIRPPAYSVGLMGAQRVPYLGVAYIAAAARENGHSVDIVDMCGEDIDRTEIIHGRYVAYGMPLLKLKERLKPSWVIGFTCMFSQDWVFHRELIAYARKLFPESIIVAGGEHVSALAEYCLDDCPQLDVCVIGEGEEVFVGLLAAISRKSDFSGVPGLVYRFDGTYKRTPRASRIKDIDKIPLPAWDLTPLENYLSRGLNYHIRRGRTIPMLATRGCPYRCTFCSNVSMWGAPWLSRNAKSVVDEMESYVQRYQADNFVFSDLTTVVSRDKIIELCNEILKRGVNVTWQLPTLRTEALDRGVLALMYKAGCREIDFAIESGSQAVLKTIDKKNDPSKMIALIKDGLAVGMNTSVNIVLGLPDEGLGDFFRSYGLAMRLALAGLHELNVFPFVPYPGSKLFQELLSEGKVKLNDDYFFNLFGYADLSQAISWSQRFSPCVLSLMRLFLLVSFYSLMFISHPCRLIQLAVNTARGVPATKLQGVLSRVFKNIGVYFSYRRRCAGENR
jgi:radical SAM superfamily enzyme YgiQ (UPF0313 family)